MVQYSLATSNRKSSKLSLISNSILKLLAVRTFDSSSNIRWAIRSAVCRIKHLNITKNFKIQYKTQTTLVLRILPVNNIESRESKL